MAQYVLTPTPASSTVAVPDRGSVANQHSNTIDELTHELRQPLSIIEALAYYLELTTTDEAVSGHLRQIQAMVLQANRILSKASNS